MIKVLDLFAGTQSVRKALDAMGVEYEYKGIDIYSPEEQNIIIDLTSDFALEMILNRLGDWKPDFIWASPVCNKFSSACAYKGGNLFFETNKEKQSIKIRTKMDDKNNRRYNDPKQLPRYQQEAKIALKMHENTKTIIKHFNKPFIIENPAFALSKYLYKDYKKNITNYCMYGFDYKKTTAIYSNKKLNLKLCNHKENHKRTMSGKKQWVKTYAERSAVPQELIIDIITQQIKGVENENN